MPENLLEDDNLLDSSLRKANPFPNDETPELDARALADLASILGRVSSAPAPETVAPTGTISSEPNSIPDPETEAPNVVQLDRSSRRATLTRRWVLGAVAAVAAGVLVAVPLGSSLNGAGKAVASPLALTTIKAATMSTQEAVTTLVEAAGNHPDAADYNPGHLRVGHWEFNSLFIPDKEQTSEPITLEDGSETMTLIQGESDDRVSIPTVSDITREEDLSGTVITTVGEPYSTTGEDVKFVPAVGNQIPGSVEKLEFKAGEMRIPFKNPPATDAKDLFEQIQNFQLSNNAMVGDGSEGFIQTVGFMLAESKMSQAQSAALLQILPMVENLEYLGTATDRWDRKSMVFGVKNPTEGGINQTMLMFNPNTGRPLAYADEFHFDGNFSVRSYNTHDYVTRYLTFSE